MKKYILFVFLLCSSFLTVRAQVIDEDFLDVIETNAATLWQDNDAAFRVSVVPEKYKKESAVIFGFRRELSIDKKSKKGFLNSGDKSLLFNEAVRFKIALNDRNAVQTFTEFYFRYSEKEDGFSGRIYKKDGAVITVNLAKAVKVEKADDVPEFFKSFFDQETEQSSRYYKVAIADLQPGDILEYVSLTRSKLNVRRNGLIHFSPQYEVCSKKYPILFNQIAIETDEKSYFKSISRNGAPDFKKEQAANSEFFRYVFTDTDRGTEKDADFLNRYRSLPFTKFQVIYSNKDNPTGVLIGNKGEVKTHFTREELARKAWEDYAECGDDYLSGKKLDDIVSSMWSDLKSNGAKLWSREDFIQYAYYRVRNFVLNRDRYISDKHAAYLLGSLLFQRDITSDLIISVSNDMAKLDDILFEDEIRYVIRLDGKYYFNPTDFSNPGELSQSLLGSEAWLIREPDKKTGTQSTEPVTLPQTSYEQNSVLYEVESSLRMDSLKLVVKRTNTYKGLCKARSTAGILRATPYMLNDRVNFMGGEDTKGMWGPQYEYYTGQVNEMKKRFAEQKKELATESLEEDYGKSVNFKQFVVLNDGRRYKEPDLKFLEEFELDGMTRKAGKKILVNLPGLVGSQLQIKKEQRIRNHAIDVGFPRKLEWKITFTIPDGYTAEGIPELNNTVDNEIGQFSSKAILQDNKVVITISKIYKQSDFPKEKWNDMLQFIDNAFNASFKNILLKPKSE